MDGGKLFAAFFVCVILSIVVMVVVESRPRRPTTAQNVALWVSVFLFVAFALPTVVGLWATLFM